jgi:hypothetical protein
MRIIILLLALFSFATIMSCKKKRGCTDSKSLNFDVDADKNDGSCRYSKVTFYAKYGAYSGIPIMSIDVTVDGNMIGSINAVYPNGPGNCAAQGTVPFTFGSGKTSDWNTVVNLANGAKIFGSGSVTPTSLQDCIKVNVTQ